MPTKARTARADRKSTLRPLAPLAQKTPSKTITTIQEKVVIFILTIRGPGNERRMKDKSVLDTKADKSRLQVSKKLIDAKEHKAIQSVDIAVRAYIKRVVLPLPFKEGFYAIPIEMIESVDAQMTQFAEQRRAKVLELKKVYAQVKDNAKAALGSHYKESDYAIDLESAYRLEWQYVSLGAPVQLQLKDNKLFTREQERLQGQWDSAIGDMRDALRMGLAELVNDLVKRLSNSADGEKRVKPSNLLKRFEEFLGNFQARNVTGDEQLEDLAKQARDLLKGVNTETLIDSMDVRKQVEKGFKKVQSTLGKLELEAKGRRRFSFDDE